MYLGHLGHISSPPAPGVTPRPDRLPTYPPPLSQQPTNDEVTASHVWWEHDNIVSHILTTRLTSTVLSILPFDDDNDGPNPRTARTVYELLRKMYSVHDHISSSALYTELCNLQCGNRVQEYVTKWRGGITQLRAAKFIISYRIVIERFLDQLPTSVPYQILQFRVMETIDTIPIDDVSAFIKLTDDVLKIDSTYRRRRSQLPPNNEPDIIDEPETAPSPVAALSVTNPPVIIKTTARCKLNPKSSLKSTTTSFLPLPSPSVVTTKTPSQLQCSNCSAMGHRVDKCFQAGGGLEGKRDQYVVSRNRAQARLAHLTEVLDSNLVDGLNSPPTPVPLTKQSIPLPVVSLNASSSPPFAGLSFHPYSLLTTPSTLPRSNFYDPSSNSLPFSNTVSPMQVDLQLQHYPQLSSQPPQPYPRPPQSSPSHLLNPLHPAHQPPQLLPPLATSTPPFSNSTSAYGHQPHQQQQQQLQHNPGSSSIFSSSPSSGNGGLAVNALGIHATSTLLLGGTMDSSSSGITIATGAEMSGSGSMSHWSTSVYHSHPRSSFPSVMAPLSSISHCPASLSYIPHPIIPKPIPSSTEFPRLRRQHLRHLRILRFLAISNNSSSQTLVDPSFSSTIGLDPSRASLSLSLEFHTDGIAGSDMGTNGDTSVVSHTDGSAVSDTSANGGTGTVFVSGTNGGAIVVDVNAGGVNAGTYGGAKTCCVYGSVDIPDLSDSLLPHDALTYSQTSIGRDKTRFEPMGAIDEVALLPGFNQGPKGWISLSTGGASQSCCRDTTPHSSTRHCRSFLHLPFILSPSCATTTTELAQISSASLTTPLSAAVHWYSCSPCVTASSYYTSTACNSATNSRESKLIFRWFYVPTDGGVFLMGVPFPLLLSSLVSWSFTTTFCYSASFSSFSYCLWHFILFYLYTN